MSSALSADFVRYWQIIMLMMMKKIASANHKVPLNFKIHPRPTAALFQKQSTVNGNLKKKHPVQKLNNGLAMQVLMGGISFSAIET